MTETFFQTLRCQSCTRTFEPRSIRTFCPECQQPLFARYDLSAARSRLDRSAFEGGGESLWRYRKLLPVFDERHIISLGEGGTPLLRLERMGKRLGIERLLLKDEGGNPTGSFKARGVSVAISKCSELEIRDISMPSAGNAGSALAAYAAHCGMKAHIFIPSDTPIVNREEAAAFGADVRLVDGVISDAAKAMSAAGSGQGWFDMSTMKEPYRLEGKKTLGYEIAGQLGWRLPDVVIYPTGGGTGLIGMWKAFGELEELGWTSGKKPRMVAVQMSGCAPIVAAVERKQARAEFWPDAATIAAGLRVPKAFADKTILDIIAESGGTAVAVGDRDLPGAIAECASQEGILLSPEGAATILAARHLTGTGWLEPGETTVIFNTGSGYKYRELMQILRFV
ncbi:MAG TPA: threonine synthase [Bacteroidota bacterium]|nr:threonine synthase [Bacteroidota bacterium]